LCDDFHRNALAIKDVRATTCQFEGFINAGNGVKPAA